MTRRRMTFSESVPIAEEIAVAFQLFDKPGAFIVCCHCQRLYYEHTRFMERNACANFRDVDLARADLLLKRNDMVIERLVGILCWDAAPKNLGELTR
ncbi:hypothetical protein LCGC14_3113890 [marine sediment metagenome]|uniref:Uncharacterized protein n=1 Tax=marine sediment metagenome TaxID=412755 RepID=A0A0F8YBN7_9ZZZZ